MCVCLTERFSSLRPPRAAAGLSLGPLGLANALRVVVLHQIVRPTETGAATDEKPGFWTHTPSHRAELLTPSAVRCRVIIAAATTGSAHITSHVLTSQRIGLGRSEFGHTNSISCRWEQTGHLRGDQATSGVRLCTRAEPVRALVGAGELERREALVAVRRAKVFDCHFLSLSVGLSGEQVVTSSGAPRVSRRF